MSRLRPHLPFDPQETHLSFANRLAALHTGGRVQPFLRYIGIDSMRYVAGGEAEVRKLCDLADVDPESVLANVPRKVAKRRYLLRGDPISAEALSRPATVFCPLCLQEDDTVRAAGGPGRTGRFLWSLSVTRTCPVHGLPLVRREKSRWSDEFQELDMRVPEREAELEALAADLVPRSISPLQAYAADRLAGASGPAWLDSQTLDQAVRATEMLGVVLAFGAQPNLRRFTQDDWDAAGRAGYACTSHGEAGIREALDAVHAEYTYRRSKPGPQAIYGRLYEWLAYANGEKDPGDIKRILREAIFDTIAYPAGKTVLGETLEQRRLHTTRSLSTEKRVDARTLHNVLLARGLIRKGEFDHHHAFDARAGERIADEIGAAVLVINVPRAVGCARPLADDLIRERVLPQVAMDGLSARGRLRKAVPEAAIDAFLDRLKAIADPVDSARPGMVPIAKAAEKSRARGVDIVHLMLGGFLSRVHRLQIREGIEAILVDPAEVREAAARTLVGISSTEAFGILKMPAGAVWALVDDQQEEMSIPAITIEGQDGAYRFHRFRREDLDAFKARVTTVPRIAEEAGLDLRLDQIGGRLKAAGVTPVHRKRDLGIQLYRVADLPAAFRVPEPARGPCLPAPEGAPAS